MTDPVRVGVIGLGRRWRRHYRPALRALAELRLEVCAVCDQVQEQAVGEARHLGCDAAAGPAELFERDDLDALLLVDPQWFGLWPLELACRARKPVLCCVPLELDLEHADTLVQQVRDSQLPVLVEMVPRYAPATEWLRSLLATPALGAVRGVQCDVLVGAEREGPADRVALLDWCVQIMGCAPTHVQVAGTEGGPLISLLLECSDGRAAQVSWWRTGGLGRGPRLEVVGEHGWAAVELPGRWWQGRAAGRSSGRFRGEPAARLVLREFAEVLQTGRPPVPSLEDAYRALTWLRAAERSRAEGRRVAIE
jgi:predicted dehydrogenase